MTGAKQAVLRETSNLRIVALALFFGLFAIAAETVLDVPMRLPGHRAFPGALALLMFTEAFTPLMLLGLAALVSSFLVMAGGADPLTVVLWVSAVVAILGLYRTRLAKTVFFFAIGGLVYGGLRYLILSHGFHHTPELVRLSGHLGFGALAGLISYGTCRLTLPRR